MPARCCRSGLGARAASFASFLHRADRPRAGAHRGSGFGGPRCARTALRCSVLPPRCQTRFVAFGHCARTVAASQSLKRAARAGGKPCAAQRRNSPRRSPALGLSRQRSAPAGGAPPWWRASPGRGPFCGSKRGSRPHGRRRTWSKRGPGPAEPSRKCRHANGKPRERPLRAGNRRPNALANRRRFPPPVPVRVIT